MAVYGRDDPALFERALGSVYENTLLPDDFVLVVDGPVPTNIERIINRYESQFRIRPTRLPENVGLAGALNHGLNLVRTDWVARADADDVNVATRFERQAEALKRIQGQVDLLGGAILEVDRRGDPVAVRQVPLNHEEIVDRLAIRNPFNHMTVAYRAAAAREVGGYPQIPLKEDYGLWAAMIARGARCLNLKQVLVKATAGGDMYKRRGGLAHVRSELELQLHLYRLGQKGFAGALTIGLARAAVALLPSAFRGWLYRWLFRTPTQKVVQ